MKYQIDVKFTKKIITDAIRQLWFKWCFNHFLIGLGSLVITITLWTVFGLRHWMVSTLIALSVILLFVEVLVFSIYRKRSLSIFERMESPTAHLEFDDTSVSMKSDTGSSTFEWKMIKKLWCFTDVWIFMYVNQAISIIPKESVTQEIEEFIIKKITENNGKIVC